LKLSDLTLRQLQIESSIALEILQSADNLSLSKINQKVNHDSTLFYTSVLEEFIEHYNCLPSETEEAKDIKIVYPDERSIKL
jgi:hypothetical protein